MSITFAVSPDYSALVPILRCCEWNTHHTYHKFTTTTPFYSPHPDCPDQTDWLQRGRARPERGKSGGRAGEWTRGGKREKARRGEEGAAILFTVEDPISYAMSADRVLRDVHASWNLKLDAITTLLHEVHCHQLDRGIYSLLWTKQRRQCIPFPFMIDDREALKGRRIITCSP